MIHLWAATLWFHTSRPQPCTIHVPFADLHGLPSATPDCASLLLQAQDPSCRLPVCAHARCLACTILCVNKESEGPGPRIHSEIFGRSESHPWTEPRMHQKIKVFTLSNRISSCSLLKVMSPGCADLQGFILDLIPVVVPLRFQTRDPMGGLPTQFLSWSEEWSSDNWEKFQSQHFRRKQPFCFVVRDLKSKYQNSEPKKTETSWPLSQPQPCLKKTFRPSLSQNYMPFFLAFKVFGEPHPFINPNRSFFLRWGCLVCKIAVLIWPTERLSADVNHHLVVLASTGLTRGLGRRLAFLLLFLLLLRLRRFWGHLLLLGFPCRSWGSFLAQSHWACNSARTRSTRLLSVLCVDTVGTSLRLAG